MTGFEPTAASQRAAPSRGRVGLPASRGGVAWLLVILVVGGFVAVQLGREVYANWQIGQDAARIERQIAEMEAANEKLRGELDYLRSEAYISAEARRLRNLGRPGERILIIPPGAATKLPPALHEKQPPPPPLVEQWLDLFFGP